MSFIPAPLHRINVQSHLVNGFFKVAVLPALPIRGVDFIQGNNVAGARVVPVPELLDSPDLRLESDNMAEVLPGTFPACV